MSGNKYLLDTNIILGYLKGQKEILRFFKTRSDSDIFFASQITRMELLGFPDITDAEEDTIKTFLSLIEVLQITAEIEECAITLRRQTRMKLPDCIVAATAIENGCVLVTNDKDLAKKQINGLKSIQSL